MKNLKRLFIFVMFFCGILTISSQNINDLSKIDSMTDGQLQSYLKQAQKSGLSIGEIESIAKAKGISQGQIAKFKQRVQSLNSGRTKDNNPKAGDSKEQTGTTKKFGHTGQLQETQKKNNIFGLDFFSNPNISFEPNMNLATPSNYQLGPGDSLLIDIWGAAENEYTEKIGLDGAIRLKGVGPVYVSGLSIEKAKSKIISKLRRIYGGISSASNYSRVNVDISLAQVRSVQVNIIGEVKVPGTYTLSALSTVLNGLYAAGGPTNKGTLRNVKVFRQGSLVSDFDIYNYLVNGVQKGNVFLRDQDLIIVKPYNNRVYVSGMVKRPGVYEFKKGETLNDLTTYFGGYLSDAYKEKITVERIKGDNKEIKEIYKGNFPVLKDGDKYSVAGISGKYDNRVKVEGAVNRPGALELSANLTLSEALKKVGGLKEDAFLQRGVIYRIIDGTQQKIVSFSVDKVIKGSTNINLQKEDRVYIFSNSELKEKYTVSINGAINKPQTIPFVENMQVEDLIALAGGFKEGADVTSVEIARRSNDGTLKTISENIKISSSNNLSLENSNIVYLKPFDIVSVRYIKGFSVQKAVSIKGEVNHPGSYSLNNKEEKIYDLVKKAGGISPYAFIKGATLIRRTTNDVGQNESIDNLNMKQDTLIVAKKSRYSVGINLDKILKNPKSKYNLVLKEGDELIIPTIQQTVKVEGEVMSPSLIRFDNSKSLKDYINNSGGFTEEARKSKVYVVYSNGEVKSTKRFLFFRTYPKIQPGALILVPKKAEVKDPLTTRDIIGITTSVTTLGVLISTLLK